MTWIGWADDDGNAILDNSKPAPGTRFGLWTPDRIPVGASSVILGTGVTQLQQFRQDDLVSFELAHIPHTSLDLLRRLEYHLLSGRAVAISSDRPLADEFQVCIIAPSTQPDYQMTDRQTMEFTLSVVLKSAPDADLGGFVPPAGADGEGVCAPATNNLSEFRAWGDSFAAWPGGAINPNLYGIGRWTSGNPPDADREAMIGADPYGDLYEVDYEIDDVPASPAMSIECVRMNGVDVHTLRATKNAGDTRSVYGVEAQARSLTPGSTSSTTNVGFQDIWTRMLFRFSNGFFYQAALDGDPGSLEQEFITLSKIVGTTSGWSAPPTYVRTSFTLRFVAGFDLSAGWSPGLLYPLTGGLEMFREMSSLRSAPNPPDTQRDRIEIIPAATLYSGQGQELVVRSWDDGDGWSVRVLTGRAFGELTEVYNEKMLYGENYGPFNRADFLPIGDNLLYTVPPAGSQFHEITHWEYADGSAHADPFGVDGVAE
jgi:hypothetical protein